MIKTGLQELFKKPRFNMHDFLFRIFERNAKNLLIKKCKKTDPAAKELLLNEDERYHYGDLEIVDKAFEYILKSFTIDRIEFITRNTRIKKQDIVIDLGDSNGIFLRSLDKTEVSVNISDPAIKALHNRGMGVIKADIAYLPFKTGSIHTVLLFETLEHVPNPVALLNEIGRVCSDSIILSVPYVQKTHIHRFNYEPGRPIFQHHIFEFNKPDLLRIFTHTPFTVAAEEIAVVLEGTSGLFDRIVFLIWEKFFEEDMFCGCFRRFYICKLCKKMKQDK
jgi:SAM-dependent methyltransferase